jgi:DTW domain-containing protein YfiP
MHRREARHQRTGTGRLCHVALPNSEIIEGLAFDRHPRLDDLLADTAWLPVLLWPGEGSRSIGEILPALHPAQPAAPRPAPLIIILDGTWSQARTMFRDTPALHGLPRVGITPTAPSAWVFKRQPSAACLSTLEAIHQLLSDLAAAGLDHYGDPTLLPGLFARLQDTQTAYLRTT